MGIMGIKGARWGRWWARWWGEGVEHTYVIAAKNCNMKTE